HARRPAHQPQRGPVRLPGVDLGVVCHRIPGHRDDHRARPHHLDHPGGSHPRPPARGPRPAGRQLRPPRPPMRSTGAGDLSRVWPYPGPPARLKATRFAPDLDDDEVYGLSARSIKPLVQYWADGDPRRISAHWKAERSLLPDVIRRPATLAVPLHLARRGGFRPRPVRQLSTFGPGRALAVP